MNQKVASQASDGKTGLFSISVEGVEVRERQRMDGHCQRRKGKSEVHV